MSAVVFAVSGPLPAVAADAAPTQVDTTEAPDPTAVGGPDLIETTDANGTSPVPLPLGRVEIPLANTPLVDLTQPTPPRPVPVTRFGGGAVGAYVEARAGVLGLKVGKVGGVYMPDGGASQQDEVSRIEVPVWPLVGAMTVSGIKSEARSYPSSQRAESTSRIAKVEVNPGNALAVLTSFFPLPPGLDQAISVDSLESTAVVSKGADGQFVTTAQSTSGTLTINGKVTQLQDYAPNTTLTVPGLGTVVINEQQVTRIPGEKYAATVHALHITLSTATAGLPAGAHIFIGTAEAIVYE